MGSDYSAVVNGFSYKSDEDLVEVKLFEGYPDSLLQFGYICCIIFSLVGIFGNLVTIIALAFCEKFRNAIAYLIINLHVCNLIYCCIILPMTATISAAKFWPLGVTMCNVYPFIKYSLVGTAHFTVVAITINRYIIICHPHVYHKIYKKSILIITLLFTWTASFFLFTPTFIGVWGRFDLDPTEGYCTIVPDTNNINPKTFFICLAFVGSYVIIISCYACIWWTVRKATNKCIAQKMTVPTITISASDALLVKNESQQDFYVSEIVTKDSVSKLSSSTASTPNDKDSSKSNFFSFTLRRSTEVRLPTRKDKKLATMIVAILIAFLICHLPLTMTRVLYGKYKSDPVVNVLAHLLEYSTAFISPLIYVMISREYRQAYNILYKAIKQKILS